MATIYFLYRSTKENAPLTVRLLFTHNSVNEIIGTNSRYLIYSKKELVNDPTLSSKYYWDKLHNNIRTKDIELRNKQIAIQKDLNKIENYILKAFNDINPESANKEWLEGVVEEFYNPKKQSSIPNTLIEFFDYYLEMNPHLKYGTQKKYTTIKNKLIKRKHLFSSTPIFLNDINDNFKLKYYKIFGDYKTNTIVRDLTEIKTLCRLALKKGKEIDLEVLDWKFKVDKTPFVSLNLDEIEKINNLKDLTEFLDNARDWLVISCQVGQRVSDLMRFEKSMIRVEKNKKGKDIYLIEFEQVKTNKLVTVPLHEKVLKILAKRNGEFPRKISDQKYNDYIKEVCKKAELTETVQGDKIIVTENGDKRTEFGTYQKWELVSSHIGRRSFATNNFGKIPTRLIMSVTAHEKETTFLTYINKTQTEQAKELADYF
jgi:integrase